MNRQAKPTNKKPAGAKPAKAANPKHAGVEASAGEGDGLRNRDRQMKPAKAANPKRAGIEALAGERDKLPKRATTYPPKGSNPTASTGIEASAGARDELSNRVCADKPAKASNPMQNGVEASAGERDELPEGWEWQTLGEAAPIDTEPILPKSFPDQWFNYIALENIESGTSRLVDFTPTLGNTIGSNKTRFTTAHVLYGKLRPYLNKVLVPEFDGVAATDILPLRPNPDQVTREYLALWLRSPDFVAYASAKMEGAKMPRLRTPDVTEALIAVPPLDEQRRIVARIEEFAQRVAEAHQHRNEATSAINAWLPSALSITFEELTDQHGTRPLKSLFTFRNDLLRPTDKVTGEVRFIGLQHIESGTGRRIGEDLVFVEQLTGRKFRFSPGEIVYGYLRPYLNKVWIADCDGLCSVDQYVLQPDKVQVDTRYLSFAMRSPFFLRQSEQLTGVLTLPRLRSGLLESIEIPVPPLDEQRRIATHLDALQAKADAIRAAQLETQRELDALMPSVLDRALRGEL